MYVYIYIHIYRSMHRMELFSQTRWLRTYQRRYLLTEWRSFFFNIFTILLESSRRWAKKWRRIFEEFWMNFVSQNDFVMKEIYGTTEETWHRTVDNKHERQVYLIALDREDKRQTIIFKIEKDLVHFVFLLCFPHIFFFFFSSITRVPSAKLVVTTI